MKSSSDQQDQQDQPEVFVTGYYEGETFFNDKPVTKAGQELPYQPGQEL